MIKNALLNRFTLQVAISTVAVVLVAGNIPLLAERAGIAAAHVGLLFFLTRLGAITGAQAGPLALRRWAPHAVSAGAEGVNALFCLALYASVVYSRPIFLFPLIFLKGIIAGLLPNVRVAWLKSLPAPEIGRRVMVISQVIVQSAYGLIGLLLILGVAQKIVLGLVLIDAATSLVAIPIFLSLRDLEIGPLAKAPDSIAARFIFARPNRPILAADLTLAVAMGGTNIFLVRTGEGLFKDIGGYGFALMVYAAAYLLGGTLIQAHKGAMFGLRKRAETAAPWVLLSCLSLLSTANVLPSLRVAAFFILFIAYPVFLLGLETRWYEKTSQSNIGRTFATRTLLISFIWAVGEVGYPRLSLGGELVVRMAAAAAATGIFLLFLRPAPEPGALVPALLGPKAS